MELKQRIRENDYECIRCEKDPRIIASRFVKIGLIKAFFSDMKEPLIPCDYYDVYLQCMPDDLVKTTRKLPVMNQKVLSYLFEFLKKIYTLAKVNKVLFDFCKINILTLDD